jgi:hypothetical protein
VIDSWNLFWFVVNAGELFEFDGLVNSWNSVVFTPIFSLLKAEII